MKIKSTRKECFSVPYIGNGAAPWGSDYRRVLIPQKCKNGDLGVIQVVHKSQLIENE